MSDRRLLRATATLGVGLVLLLLVEVPALAHPRSPAIDGDAEVTAPRTAEPTDRFLRCSPIQLRRAAARQAATGNETAATDVGRWEPTLSEGAVFTAMGSGLLLAGGIITGVGMAKLIPIVTEAAGLVTAATNPLLLLGVGLTLLITGIAFLVHGVEVLKVVRDMEERAAQPSARSGEPARGPWTSWSGSSPGTPQATVLLRF